MRRILVVIYAVLLGFTTLCGQDTLCKVVLKPEVPEDIWLSDELKGVLYKKMVQMCTQNGVEAGESNFVIYPEITLRSTEMTATIPQRCIVELGVVISVVNSDTGERISETDYTIKSIESSKDKAINKAISRMNVKTSQIRKFMVVTRNKIQELCR